MTLQLTPGLNVLLGATLAGKTSLLRLIAGLEQPTSGRVYEGDLDVTGVPVQQRKLAMVYQQFINYPSLTVFENIASPLRLARLSEDVIRERVHRIAEKLRLSALLERRPAELSGGQQQRTALARALAKEAKLVLLDEPLVNLDYKLREDLRVELKQLFTEGEATVVYATTEPQEALQLGGKSIVLDTGRLVQHAATLDVFRSPATLQAARAFSDPPLNEMAAEVQGEDIAVTQTGVRLRLPTHAREALGRHTTSVILGIRPHELSLHDDGDAAAIAGRVDLAEISGSETYVHIDSSGQTLVAQLQGVHRFTLGDSLTLFVRRNALYGFDRGGHLLFAPR